MLGFRLRTITRYRDGTLEVPTNVRLHMEALRRLGPKKRLALNRIGWTLALKEKEARNAE